MKVTVPAGQAPHVTAHEGTSIWLFTKEGAL